MRKKIVAGNWKMNLNSEKAHKLLKNLESISFPKDVEVIIAPPSIYLDSFSKAKNLFISSQDVSSNDNGAYTGEFSAEMLSSLNLKYSIIGHSERRQFFNEKNDEIKQKILKIVNKTLTILCIGETEEENKNDQTKDVLKRQLEVIKDIEFNDSLVIAYEPVWAIGTGNTPTPDKINEIHKFIKDVVQSFTDNSAIPMVLYGGSVNQENAENFFKEESVDGALIGGASLDGKQFANIINIFNGTNLK